MRLADAKEKQQRRESPAGYHYFYAYLENPRNWFLKYVIGIKPRFTSPALLKGGALHEARAEFFQSGFDTGAMLKTYKDELTSRSPEYERQEDFYRDLALGEVMLQAWAFEMGPVYADLWEPIEWEQPYEFDIGPEGMFKFTVRPDTVCRNRQNGTFAVFDMKTTGWSIDKTIEQAQSEDQITSYLWAMRKAHPEWNIRDGFIDVIFCRSGKTGPGVPQCQMSEPIYRTDLDLTIFELNIVGLIAEISQKVVAYKQGVPWPLLFPRNGRAAGLFGDDYKALSRLDVRPGECPPGFVKDDWSEDVEEFVKVASSVDWQKVFQGKGGKG